MTQVSVLIDLHQQRKNNWQTIQISDLNAGQPHVNEEQNPRTTRNIPFPNQMIEQINIALEQKGIPGISQPEFIGNMPSEITSEKKR